MGRGSRRATTAARLGLLGGAAALAAAWLLGTGPLPDGPRAARGSPPRAARGAPASGVDPTAPEAPAAAASPVATSSRAERGADPAGAAGVEVATRVVLDDRLEVRRAELLARLTGCCQARLEVTWREDDPALPDALVLEDAPARASDPRAAAALAMRDLAAALGGGWEVADDAQAAPRALVPGEPLDADPRSVLVPFQPHLEGLPVQHGRLTLELERRPDGVAPRRLVGRWDPAPSLAGQVAPAVEAALAAPPAPAALEGGVTPAAAPRLVAAPVDGGGCRRAFVVDRRAPDGADTRRVTVDAETGATLSDDSIQCAGAARGLTYARDPGATPRAPAALPGLYVVQGRGARRRTPAGGTPSRAA